VAARVLRMPAGRAEPAKTRARTPIGLCARCGGETRAEQIPHVDRVLCASCLRALWAIEREVRARALEQFNKGDW